MTIPSLTKQKLTIQQVAGAGLAVGLLLLTAACGGSTDPSGSVPSTVAAAAGRTTPTVGSLRRGTPTPAAVAAFKGELDPGFGQGGQTILDFGSLDEEAQAVVVQPDGKLLVTGEGRPSPNKLPHFIVMRLDSRGKLDPTFGSGGRVATNVTGQEYGSSFSHALALQPDGKIVVAGAATNYEVHHLTFAIARYNPDGSLDETFGTGGSTVTPIDYQSGSGADEEALDVAVQPDGKIVVVGVGGKFPTDFGVMRYTAGGQLDPTFGDGGIVLTDFGYADTARSVVIQPDGMILVAGTGETGSSFVYNDFALARYRPDGSLDPTFGQGGKLHTTFADQQAEEAHQLILQSDGKIVVAGPIGDGAGMCFAGQICGYYGFGLVRYNANGTLDTRFGDGGKTVTRFDLQTGGNYAIVRRPDGTLVTAGHVNDDFALATFTRDGKLITSIGNKGLVRTNQGIEIAHIYALALQSDGKVVAVGVDGADPNDVLNSDFAVARYR
jgi:uncharacterized delta-60 repeat protein